MRKINKCVLCNSRNFQPLFEAKDRIHNLPGTFHEVRCRKCGIVFLNPQPTEQEIKPYYPKNLYYAYIKNAKSGLVGKLRENIIKNYYNSSIFHQCIRILIPNSFAIPKYIKKGTVLDIGCGTGDILLLLKEMGWDVYGTEIDENAISIARKNGLKNVTFAAVKDINNFPNNFFDAVRLYHVIEHINDPNLCIKIIHKKLKKGGQLLITTPNIESPVAHFFKKWWSGVDAPRHLFLFSSNTVRKLIENNEFFVEKVEFCSATGISGSIYNYINDIVGRKISIAQKLGIALYPLEWILNKSGLGDHVTIRATKK